MGARENVLRAQTLNPHPGVVIMRMYSLLDRKLREFGAILVERNEDSMRRSLYNGVKGSNSMVEKYSEDFDLYALGEFNVETGVVTPETPRIVGTVRSILVEYGSENGNLFKES